MHCQIIHGVLLSLQISPQRFLRSWRKVNCWIDHPCLRPVLSIEEPFSSMRPLDVNMTGKSTLEQLSGSLANPSKRRKVPLEMEGRPIFASQCDGALEQDKPATPSKLSHSGDLSTPCLTKEREPRSAAFPSRRSAGLGPNPDLNGLNCKQLFPECRPNQAGRPQNRRSNPPRQCRGQPAIALSAAGPTQEAPKCLTPDVNPTEIIDLTGEPDSKQASHCSSHSLGHDLLTQDARKQTAHSCATSGREVGALTSITSQRAPACTMQNGLPASKATPAVPRMPKPTPGTGEPRMRRNPKRTALPSALLDMAPPKKKLCKACPARSEMAAQGTASQGSQLSIASLHSFQCAGSAEVCRASRRICLQDCKLAKKVQLVDLGEPQHKTVSRCQSKQAAPDKIEGLSVLDEIPEVQQRALHTFSPGNEPYRKLGIEVNVTDEPDPQRMRATQSTSQRFFDILRRVGNPFPFFQGQQVWGVILHSVSGWAM